MSYKSIVTFIVDESHISTTLAYAIETARQSDAHLDVFCLGVDRTQTGYYYGGINAIVAQEALEHTQAKAGALEKTAEAQLTASGVRFRLESAATQLTALSGIVSAHARFADLVILPQPYGKKAGQELEALTEAAMFDAHAPVLITPPNIDSSPEVGRVVIAWNESSEALTAIRAAMPLLQRASHVNVAIIDPPKHSPNRSDPGGALSEMLVRHGVKVEISVLAKTLPRVSDVLKRHITDMDADLVVMGGYGHSRFREAILGGATRYMLENATTRILLAH
ncbi:MAG: universal stress protein [Halocynthiibacter sp.]